MTNTNHVEVAIAAVPMMGHLTPLLPYAAELLERGHKVTFFHESSRKYKHKLLECGLLSNPNCRSVTYDCPDGKWSDVMYRTLLSHYEQQHHTKPNIVVYDFFAVDVADAAEKLGVESIGVFPNPQSINPWAASAQEQSSWRWKLWCAVAIPFMEGILSRLLWMTRSYKRYRRNLPILKSQDIYPSPSMPRAMISSYAPQLEFPEAPDAPLLCKAGPSQLPSAKGLDPELQAWLDLNINRAIVYVAFGTMYKYSKQTVETMESQLSMLGNDMAVLWSLPTNQQSYLSEASKTRAEWKISNFLPQQSLFQSRLVDVFVTHCGSNSVSEAIMAGVPMVCCPGFADQPANASRIARAGVGILSTVHTHDVRSQTPSLATAIRRILHPSSSIRWESNKLAAQLDSRNSSTTAVDFVLQKAAAKQTG